MSKKRKAFLFALPLILTVSVLIFLTWGGVSKPDIQLDEIDSSAFVDSDFKEGVALAVNSVETKIKWGDNLADILKNNGIKVDEINSLIPTVNQNINLRKIQVGTEVKMMSDDLGLKLLVLHEPNTNIRLLFNRKENLNYLASEDVIPQDTVLVMLNGQVESSFYASFMEAGGNADLAIKFIDVFQYVYYFAFRTRSGDKYSMIAEEIWQDGEKVGYGKILSASWEGKTDSLYAVWYPISDGDRSGEYFDVTGTALRRNLLLLPFPTARVTSGYGYRFHPKTGKYKKHHGVDIAAKRGTPVVAAGAGQVTIVGRGHPGYGNWVHVKHGKSGFETRYGHFQRIARGIRKGKWVKQGDVIGYVGSTGLSTGPHLHYEVFKNGKRLNPLNIKGSPVQKLNKDELEDFNGWYSLWNNLLLHPGTLPSDQHQGPVPESIVMK